MRRIKFLLAGAAVAAVCIILGLILGELFDPGNLILSSAGIKTPQVTEIRAGGYSYINPLLECESDPERYKLTGLDFLHDKIQSYLDSQKQNGVITDASVYVRDLNNGPWFGINEHSYFAPASLLKVPILIAYYKKAEEVPSILEKQLAYNDDTVKIQIPEQNYSRQTLIKGRSYTTQDLLVKMIRSSDNTATIILDENIGDNYIDKTTGVLGVETSGTNAAQNYMSTKGYASLYRILFNASYLTRNDSERALKLLSETEFDQGIVAGVPRGIKVSHKYGERAVDNINELHDCGIVYLKDHPYLICVMTRGPKFADLAKFIENTSKMVFEGIKSKS